MAKVILEQYLHRTVFYQKRTFTRQQFREFMFAQSKPFPEMIGLVRRLKARHQLEIAVVSNEGRELSLRRIKRFKLDTFVGCFISSCFVHFRKPDEDIYRLALHVAQVRAEQVVHIEGRPMFVQVAGMLGIRGMRHTDCQTTRAQLAALGLEPAL